MKSVRLADRLGYRFANPLLLEQALTHPSFSSDNNQRLEYLGDSVLNCVIAQGLFERFPQLGEGALSRLRAKLVRQDSLAEIASGIGVGDALRLGEGERKCGGAERASNLADALEAILGAAHIDGGFPAAQTLTLRLFEQSLSGLNPAESGKDPKTQLQEALMARKMALPTYTLCATRGLDHKQEFEVECAAVELSLRFLGTGTTRRAAEQAAAGRVLQALGELRK